MKMPCGLCKGTGYVEHSGVDIYCPQCGGFGEVYGFISPQAEQAKGSAGFALLSAAKDLVKAVEMDYVLDGTIYEGDLRNQILSESVVDKLINLTKASLGT